MIHAVGKKVYWVNGKRFYNTKGKRDGHDKAEEYCLDNFISTQDIIQFDSDTETDYYDYLLKKQDAGLISNLNHHFTLKVQDAFKNSEGHDIPPVTYEADFIYKDNKTGKRMVVDVKGSEWFLSNDGGRFILLKQLFDKVFLEKGLYIQIILKKNKEWVEWHIGDKKASGKLIKKQRDEIARLREEVKKQNKMTAEIEKDKATIIKYRDWLNGEHGLTKKQLERLKYLEEKYKV